MKDEYCIDVVELIKIILTHFNKELVKEAFKHSYKTTEIYTFRSKKSGTLVPNEAFYHFEVMKLLRSWLPTDLYSILPMANAGKKIADLKIVHKKHGVVL